MFSPKFGRRLPDSDAGFWRACSMDEFIAKANIEHFEKLLATETDAQKRCLLESLLAEEKLKLAAALSRRNDSKHVS